MEAEADGAPAKNKAPLADQGELATKEPEGIRTPDHPRIIPLFNSLESMKHYVEITQGIRLTKEFEYEKEEILSCR